MELDNRIKNLSEYKYQGYPVTSLYLRMEPQDRQNLKYKLKAKNLVKDMKRSLSERALSKSSLDSIDADFTKILSHLDNVTDISECRGIAVFSSSGGKYWEIYKLPAVYRNQLVVDRAPHLGQLIKINDEYSDIVAAVIDRKKARIFRLAPDGAHEILDYFYPGASRTRKQSSPEGKFKQRVSQVQGTGSLAQGYGEHGFHRTIENEIHQHYKYIADKVFEYYKDNKFKWLIVGGTEKNISEFSDHLHTYLRDILAGAITADVDKIKPYQVMDAALDALGSKKADTQKQLIGEFEEKLPSGLTVNGIDPTLSALSIGQLRVLLIEEEFSAPGFMYPDSGVFVTEENRENVPQDEEPDYIVDVVDLAIEEAYRQKAEIEILSDGKLKKKINGMAGILRFKL
jgi:peptide subunit release factor 1 (eRF1)